jgi:cobalt-zinc-cadmium efflux system protein
VGLAVNGVSAWQLARSRGSNANMRAAMQHLLADAAGSVAAVGAGFSVLAFGAAWVDPAASLLIAVLVVASVYSLLREVADDLLEATPRGLDPAAVAATLHTAPEVQRVHHLHVWRLSSGSIALSAHVVAGTVDTLHDAQLLADRLKELLARDHAIDHATLELECHDCRGSRLVAPADLARRRP